MFNHFIEALGRDIHLKAYNLVRVQRPLKQHCHIFDFFTLPGIFPGFFVGNQLGIGCHQFMYDLQPMGTDCRLGFSHLNNSIGKPGNDFRLSGAPRKFNIYINLLFCKKLLGHTNKLCRHLLALKVFHAFDIRITRNRHNPPGRTPADFGIDQIRDHNDIRSILHDPVLAGNAGIKNTLINISRHLLRPAYRTGKFIIVHLGEIASRSKFDPPSRFFKQLNGCFFETPLRNPKF